MSVAREASGVVERSVGCCYHSEWTVTQPQFLHHVLKHRRWNRNWEIEVSRACVILPNNFIVLRKDWEETISVRQVLLQTRRWLRDKCLITSSVNGGNVSYSTTEKGQTPKLNDLAQFVKWQAAINNNPGFKGSSKNRPHKDRALWRVTFEHYILIWKVCYHLRIAG